MRRRILSALATLALGAAAFGYAGGTGAEAEVMDGANPDPIGDLIETVVPATDTNPPTPEPQAAPETSPAPTSDPDWRFRATLYHSGAGGVGTRDALGCRVVPMRTVAVDRGVVPRRSILFIRETVGLVMPDGSRHDGYWYASDTGGAIHGNRIDLYTGMNAASMAPIRRLSTATVSVTRVGSFEGCPVNAAPRLASGPTVQTLAAKAD